jgi:zinc transporter, ZIP family
VSQLGLRHAGADARVGVLALTGGVLATVALEEMIPEAHEEKDSRLAAVCSVGGFALFILVSTWAGSSRRREERRPS